MEPTDIAYAALLAVAAPLVLARTLPLLLARRWPIGIAMVEVALEAAIARSPLYAWASVSFWIPPRAVFAVALLVVIFGGIALSRRWALVPAAWALSVLCLTVRLGVAPTAASGTLRVGIVQATPKGAAQDQLRRLLELEETVAQADLIVWPEGAYPYVEDVQASQELARLPAGSGTRIVGAFARAATLDPSPMMNGAVIQSRQRTLFQPKSLLVPRFETARAVGGPVPGLVEIHGLRVAVVLCAEAILGPTLSAPPDLVVILASDAWDARGLTGAFGYRSAARIAERLHVPVVRASTANSLVVLPDGSVLAATRPGNGSLFTMIPLGKDPGPT